MKSYELFAELASENRLGILHALKEKPLKFTALASEIKATSPAASRQIHGLTSAELIFKELRTRYDLTQEDLAKLVGVRRENQKIGKFTKVGCHHKTHIWVNYLLGIP